MSMPPIAPLTPAAAPIADDPAPAPTVRSSRAMVDEALALVRTLAVADALALHGDPAVRFVDLREPGERADSGAIPDALHAPRGVLEFWADPASPWHRPEFSQPGTRLLLYCAIGWRSALAARTLQEMGLPDVAHLGGGFVAWRDAGGPVAVVAAAAAAAAAISTATGTAAGAGAEPRTHTGTGIGTAIGTDPGTATDPGAGTPT